MAAAFRAWVPCKKFTFWPQSAAIYLLPLNSRSRDDTHEMTQSTPICLWNVSASICEYTYSIEHGAVGATCNPVIVLGVLEQELAVWKDRIRNLINRNPASGEDDLRGL
jgi:transaldolase